MTATRAVLLAPSDHECAGAEYWRSKTPEERVSAVEFLRRQCALTAGDGPMPRLVKVLRLVDRKKA